MDTKLRRCGFQINRLLCFLSRERGVTQGDRQTEDVCAGLGATPGCGLDAASYCALAWKTVRSAGLLGPAPGPPARRALRGWGTARAPSAAAGPLSVPPQA